MYFNNMVIIVILASNRILIIYTIGTLRLNIAALIATQIMVVYENLNQYMNILVNNV
jgi:hypothetical protein